MDLFDKEGNAIDIEKVLADAGAVVGGIPQSRFKEVNDQKKQATQELETLRAELNELRDKKLSESGDFKTLLDESRAKITSLSERAERVDVLEAIITQAVDSTVETLPKPLRSLVPDGTPESRFKWLEANKSLLMKPDAFSFAASDKGQRAPGKLEKEDELSDEEKQVAARFNMSEDEYKVLRKSASQDTDKPKARTNMLG